jgi:hypothetical protein
MNYTNNDIGETFVKRFVIMYVSNNQFVYLLI